MKKSKLPLKSFNLFWSFDVDVPFSERLYKWITSVGKYIVIGVEMVVLSAFIARFILDQNLNDLTDSINEKNQALVSLKPDEARIKDIQDKSEAAKSIITKNPSNLLGELPKINALLPKSMFIKNITYSLSTASEGIKGESFTISLSGNPNDAPKYKQDLQDLILNPENKIPNPYVTLKELNVVATSQVSAEYTFKITTTGN